jgi:uncharacterized protein (TIGR00159 family)
MDLIFLIKIGFLPVSIWDLLDILIVGYLFYVLYKLARGQLAFNILIGAGVLLAIYWLVNAAQMSMLSFILSGLAQFGFIVLIVVFQPEIRRFLIFIGRNFLSRRPNFLKQFVGATVIDTDIQFREKIITKLTGVVERLAKAKTGALIIFINNPEFYGLGDVGVLLDAQISGRMIESIFHKESPLHDGAMLITDGKVHSAGCILPVSDSKNLPKSAGLRHRAGVGITEQTDAFSIIVSEETGQISIARRGHLTKNIQIEKLSKLLRKLLSVKDESTANDELSVV